MRQGRPDPVKPAGHPWPGSRGGVARNCMIVCKNYDCGSELLALDRLLHAPVELLLCMEQSPCWESKVAGELGGPTYVHRTLF